MPSLIFSYFILTAASEIFSIGSFTLRWNAVLFITGFLLGRKWLLWMYRKQKIDFKVSMLSIYLVLAAMIGARLVHLLLYEPESIGSKIHTVILPFEWQPFNLLSRSEFSAYGAVLGIVLLALVYRRALGQTFMEVLDRISLPCAIAASFVCFSSFMDSEVVGKQTTSSLGTVFVEPVSKGLLKLPCCIMRSPDGNNPLLEVVIRKDPAFLQAKTSHPPIILDLLFQPGVSEQLVREFLVGDVKTFLYDMARYVHEPGTQPLRYSIVRDPNGSYRARIGTRGIARFPVQIFEGLALLMISALLFAWWLKAGAARTPGRLFALFMISFWSLHFLFQFMRQPDDQVLQMGIPATSYLNILFIVVGMVVLFRSSKNVPSLQH